MFWIGTAWPDGGGAAELCAVGCCFFAARDDPVPAIKVFLTWSFVGVVVDGILLFGVLPAASSFEMLTLALAAPYLLFGALAATPATAPIGAALTVIGATLLALQTSYDASFAPYVNSSLGLVAGFAAAAVITSIVRSAGAEWSAMRLLRRGWKDLAVAAARRGQGDRAQFAGLMMDRISLVAPRIAAAGPGSDLRAIDLLGDLRVGLNIVSLRGARRALPADARAASTPCSTRSPPGSRPPPCRNASARDPAERDRRGHAQPVCRRRPPGPRRAARAGRHPARAVPRCHGLSAGLAAPRHDAAGRTA